MKINLWYVLAALVIYFLFFKGSQKEGFETNQRVKIKTADGKFAKICDEKHLCLTSTEGEAETFSVMKFSEDLIALSKGGYYVSSCFGVSCDDFIKVNSFNPYAPNSKLALESDGDNYLVKFYDDKYMSVDDRSNVIKVAGKDQALRVQIV